MKRIHPKYVCFNEDKYFISCSFIHEVDGVFKDSFVFMKPKSTNDPWLPVPEGADIRAYYDIQKRLNKCK